MGFVGNLGASVGMGMACSGSGSKLSTIGAYLSFTALLPVLPLGVEIQTVKAGPATAEQVLYLGTGAFSAELHRVGDVDR